MSGEDYIKSIYKDKLNGNPDDLKIDQPSINYNVVKGNKKVTIKSKDVDDQNALNIENTLSLLD